MLAFSSMRHFEWKSYEQVFLCCWLAFGPCFYLLMSRSLVMFCASRVCKLHLLCRQLTLRLTELNRSLVMCLWNCLVQPMIVKSCIRHRKAVWIGCLFPWMVRKSGDLLGRYLNSAWSWEPFSDHTWSFLQMLIHWYSEMYCKWFERENRWRHSTKFARKEGSWGH